MIPSTAQVLGFFNLVVGLMLISSLGLFVGGFIMYLIRLGTWPTYRDDALRIMEFGVSVLFTLIMLLAIQQFLATHIMVAVSAAGLIIIVLFAWVIVRDLATQAPERPATAAPGPPRA